MARIVDEAGVEIQPETAGFGAELRADVDRGLTEATAGQNREVRIRVTTDSAVAEAQLRRVLAGIGGQVEQLAKRIQERANRLTTALEARIVRVATKIRTETVKLRTRITEIMTPFWAKLRGELERVQRGWQAVQNVATKAADGTRRAWVTSLDAASRGWRLVEAGAKATGDRIGRAMAPALARVRSEVLRLKQPFDVVSAYGTASFRILRSGGVAAMRRLRAEVEPDLRMIRAGVDRVSSAGRAIGGAFSTGFSRAGTAVSALGARIAQTTRYTSDYEVLVKRSGVTVEGAFRDMADAMNEQHDATVRLRQITEQHIDVEERRELAEVRVTRTLRESATASDALAAAEAKLDAARDDASVSADRLAQLELEVERARENALQTSVRLREEESKRDELVRRVVETNREHATALQAVGDATENVADRTRIHTTVTRESTTWHGRLRAVVQRTTGAVSALTTAFRNNDRSATDAGQVVTRLGGSMDRAGRRAINLGMGFRIIGQASVIAGTAVSGLGSVMTGVTGLFKGTEGAADALRGGLGGIASAAGQAASVVIQFGVQLTLFLAIAGAVSFAVGAIGAAIAGLPVLITGAVASFSVLALGMDGIKKAYETGLKPALSALKTQVSDVFETTLTPAMRRLGEGLIPAITQNTRGLAQAFADTGVAVIDLVNRGDNIRRIQSIIDNTADSARNLLSPALQNVVQQFINIGAQRPIMNAMVGIVSDLVNNVANWLGEMDRLGLITPAVEALRSALDSTGKAITTVLTSAVRFFTQAEPGFSRLMTSVGDLASTLLDDLGGAFDTALQAAADFIDNIPPESLAQFKEAVVELADSFMEFANSPAPGMIVDGITAIIEIFSMFVDVISWVAELDENITGFFNNLMVSMGTATEETKRAADEYNRLGTTAEDAGSRVETGLGDSLNRTSGIAATAGTETADAWRQSIQPIPADTTSSMAAAAENLRGQGGVAAQRAGAGAAQTAEQWRAGLDPIAPDTHSSMAAAAEEIRGQGGVAAQRAGVAGHDIQVGVVNPMTGIPEQAGQALSGLPPAIGAPMTESARMAADGARAVAISFDLNPVVINTNTSMSAIQTSVGDGMAGVRTSVETGAQGVVTAANNMATQVAGAGDRVRGSVDGMAGAVDGAAGRVTASLDGAATAGSASMNRLADAVQAAGQRAAQVTTDSFRQMQDAIRQSLDESVRVTEDSWRRMETAFRDGGRKVVDISRDTAKQVVSAITEQSGAMYDAGVTLIERLAAGMTSAQGRATAAAARVAASIRAQFPSSPAKEGPLSGRGDPQRSGGTIISRLADGITARAQLVAAALRPVLAKLRDHLAGLAPGGRGGMIQAEDGSWVNPDFYSGRPKRPVPTLTSSVRDTAGASTVRPRGEAEQAGSAADYDALRSAVELGIQTGIAEAMRPISATGLARINAKGAKDLQRR